MPSVLLRRAATGAVAALTALAVATPAAATGGSTIGSPGLGDPYFPLAGNGGYDVKHYSLDLDYVRAGNQLDATAVISARATQNLSRFNLDLRGFTISSLRVDGSPARFTRDGQELIITPRKRLKRGTLFGWFDIAGELLMNVSNSGKPRDSIV